MASVYGGFTEGVNHVVLQKAEERACSSGDKVGVEGDPSPALASFTWAVLGSYDFVVSVVGHN